MNLANLPQEEKDKINVDLAASGVAYKRHHKRMIFNCRNNHNSC